MKRLIIINGSGGVGKDTFVNMCGNHCDVANISTVDKVKEIARLCGWRYGKTDKDRKFLSDLKFLISNYSDELFEETKHKIKFYFDNGFDLVFLHAREPEEIYKYRDTFAPFAKTVLVTNKNVPMVTTNESDANVLNFKYDYEVANDGDLEDLENIARVFVERLLNEDSK